jgi:hypothetical protein
MVTADVRMCSYMAVKTDITQKGGFVREYFLACCRKTHQIK